MAPARDPEKEGGDGGFTMVEFVLALGIIAFVFTALASSMIALMNAIGVQKSRTQGNDIATIGIEDLQRLSYNDLGLCAAPSGSTPPGLADTVLLPNCGAATKYGPCEAGVPPANAVADEQYTCQRRGVEYSIRRYVAYGDVAHTVKRLAVFVEWYDTAGHHQVSQQSSLRIPSQSAIVGLTPPGFDRANTKPNSTSVALNADGSNASDMSFQAKTTGLQAGVGDTVIVVLSTLVDGGRQHQSVPLTTTNGTNWSGTLPAGGVLPDGTKFSFGPGTQFATFTATRKSDGKVNSIISETPITFTTSTPPPRPAAIAITQQPPSTVSLNATGDLLAPITIKALTDWITPDDGVTLTFETQTGAVSIAMQRGFYEDGACTDTKCRVTWEATISPSSGYHFVPSPPNRRFFLQAGQIGPIGLYPTIDAGSTAAASTIEVTFS